MPPTISIKEDGVPIEVDKMLDSLEEADSTSQVINNVISIPDTDPMPHDMSNDLLAMVETPNLKREPMNVVDSTSNRSSTFQNPPPVINLQLSVPPVPSAHTPIITPPPIISSPAAPGKKISPGKKGSGKDIRKPLRQYNPDHHCGVVDKESNRHCTRALTCKSHSVLLKRKIEGRTKPFDELVAAHKANKEAMAIAARSVSSSANTTSPAAGIIQPAVESVLSSIAPNPLNPSRFQKVSTNWNPNQSLQQQQLIVATSANGAKKSLLACPAFGKELDENLHYTTDHPKPLAVCTFGGRRMGGLLVPDRSQFLTRKVVRVAITAGGFHRIRPQNRLNKLRVANVPDHAALNSMLNRNQPRVLTSTAPIVQAGTPLVNNYLVNYNVGPANQGPAINQATIGLKRPAPGTSIIKGAQTVQTLNQATARLVNLNPLPPGTQIATNNGTVPINIAAADGSFRTDIQDFKGGIKFELPRKPNK